MAASVVCVTAGGNACALEAEVDGRVRGVFTTALCKVLRDELRNVDRISNEAFHVAAVAALRRVQRRGHAPQMQFGFSSHNSDLQAPFAGFVGSFHDRMAQRAADKSAMTTGGSQSSTRASSGGISENTR